MISWGMLFREWLDRQKIIVEDWPYTGIDFCGDLDMLLPAGEQWDEGGKTLDQNTTLFMCFVFYNVFGFYHVYVLMMYLMLLADVGPERLVGLAPEARRDPQSNRELALLHPSGNAVEEITCNLEGLTDGILDYKGIKEVPVEYQRHTVRVAPRVHRLLR